MALSSREVFLVLRARDEATRVLRGFSSNMKNIDKETAKAAQTMAAHGQAMTSVGIGLIAAGTTVAAFFKSAVDASIEYTRQAALTKTQTDKVQVSIEQLKDIGREVGMTMPTDFDKVQSSLYDIFSSIDVNLPQAKKLLHEFAMESVAGQESLQEAGKGTVGILNAFKIPIKDVRTVSDTMFQLVRKGVGTYQQFNRTIGRAVPSAARAGQSFQSLAGMMAFLTRNGISAAMASASAGRALDAISNEKVVGRLEKMGIKVRDAAGEFMPMNKIMTQLGEKMKDMTGPERAAALNDLFKGAGGTIQARRFFDLAVKNYAQLNQYTDAMINSKGAMQEAYNVMFKQPQSQAILLSNNFKILKTEVGDALVPAWLKVTGAVIKVVQWFNRLDPNTRKMIVKIAALTTTITIFLGVVLTVVGAILLFVAALSAAGIGIGTFLAIAGGVVAVIVAIGVAIFLVIKYHKQIWAFMQMVWGDAVKLFFQVKDAIVNYVHKPLNDTIAIAKNVGSFFKSVGLQIADWAKTVGHWFTVAGKYLGDKFGGPVHEIGGWFVDAGKYIANWAKQIGGWFADAGKYIADAGKEIYKDLQDTVGTVVPIITKGAVAAWGAAKPVLSAIWDAIKKGAGLFWQAVKPALDRFAEAWPKIRGLLDKSVNVIVSALMGMAKIIKVVVEFVGKQLLGLATPIKFIVKWVGITLIGAFQLLVDIIKFVAPYVATFLVDALYVCVAAFKFFAAIVTRVVPPIMQMIGRVIANIIDILRGLIIFVLGVFTGNWKKAWEGVKIIVGNTFQLIWDILKGVFKTIVGLVVGFVKGIIDAFMWLYNKLVGHSIIPDLAKAIIYWFTFLWKEGIKLFNTLISGIVSLATKLLNLVIGLAKSLPAPFIKAGTWLYQRGKDFVQGLLNGIQIIASTVRSFLANHIIGPAVNRFLEAGKWLVQAGKNFIAGFLNGAKEIWKTITKWISDIATWIRDHKGPVWLDGKLLVPAGKAIMQGFYNGLLAGSSAVYKLVNELGAKTVKAIDGKISVGNATGMKKIVQSVANQMFGWGSGYEWDALVKLVTGESGFRSNAQNPTSSAYGLFQFLDSTWGTVGAHKTSDPTQQTIAGLKYIKKVYGSPAQAYAAWSSRNPHWYRNGGMINEPIMGYGMRTGTPYGFGEGGRKEWVFNEEQMSALRGGGGTTVPINIYTQEIDPRKHAADLGWEISRRLP